jgi:hypothetical protein
MCWKLETSSSYISVLNHERNVQESFFSSDIDELQGSVERCFSSSKQDFHVKWGDPVMVKNPKALHLI